MNYQRIYDQIIENRKQHPFDGYVEKHHIVPRSFGGSDDPSNIVKLSAREHFLCHWLLTKIHPTGKLHYKAIHAFALMVWYHGENQERYRCTSRLYERLKSQFSSVMSTFCGDKNSQHGTMWITNDVESRKIKKNETIPDGWRRGRTNVFSEETKERIRETSKNRKVSEETKEKLKKHRTGRKHTEETREKIAKTVTGRKHSEHSKQLMREKKLGIPRSEETKRKISRTKRKASIA